MCFVRHLPASTVDTFKTNIQRIHSITKSPWSGCQATLVAEPLLPFSFSASLWWFALYCLCTLVWKRKEWGGGARKGKKTCSNGFTVAQAQWWRHKHSSAEMHAAAHATAHTHTLWFQTFDLCFVFFFLPRCPWPPCWALYDVLQNVPYE